jgi:Flp pilus assembly protein TadG
VEFALVAPVFFLTVLGVIELGRGLMLRHMLTNAARQGCRVGILPQNGNTEIQTAANKTLTPLGIKSDTVTVQVNDGTGDAKNAKSDDEVTVIVSVPVSSISWVPVPKYLSGTLTGQYTLRKE